MIPLIFRVNNKEFIY